MEEKKVYVVTDGYYSDYNICGVFTDRDSAEEFRDCGGYDRIEEFPLDQPIKRELKKWHIRLNFDGSDDDYANGWCRTYWSSIEDEVCCSRLFGSRSTIYCLIPNEKYEISIVSDCYSKALKIAQEKFMAFKAFKYMYPLVDKKACATSPLANSSHRYYPTYDLDTKEVLLRDGEVIVEE